MTSQDHDHDHDHDQDHDQDLQNSLAGMDQNKQNEQAGDVVGPPRAEDWTVEMLAELVEEPRLWLVKPVLDLARALDWRIQNPTSAAGVDEPGVEVGVAIAMVQHLAEQGLLVQPVSPTE